MQTATRGKQTCDNAAVPVSDAATRLVAPEDFAGDVCRMIEDSFEGPYFTCAPAAGRAIAEGQAGQPLTVALRLVDGDCRPIPEGVVDIWACNATGHYSGYGYSPNESPPMMRAILFGYIEPDRTTHFCHPREEHFLPCHVCAGVANGRHARAVYRGPLHGKAISALQW